MSKPKKRKTKVTGSQSSNKTNEDAIKGYQPKAKPSKEDLNPPSGGSNVSQSDSQRANTIK